MVSSSQAVSFESFIWMALWTRKLLTDCARRSLKERSRNRTQTRTRTDYGHEGIGDTKELRNWGQDTLEGIGDSASSDFQVFSWFSDTTSPHVSPHGAFFAGVVGIPRRSGSKGAGIGWFGGVEVLAIAADDPPAVGGVEPWAMAWIMGLVSRAPGSILMVSSSGDLSRTDARDRGQVLLDSDYGKEAKDAWPQVWV